MKSYRSVGIAVRRANKQSSRFCNFQEKIYLFWLWAESWDFIFYLNKRDFFSWKKKKEKISLAISGRQGKREGRREKSLDLACRRLMKIKDLMILGGEEELLSFFPLFFCGFLCRKLAWNSSKRSKIEHFSSFLIEKILLACEKNKAELYALTCWKMFRYPYRDGVLIINIGYNFIYHNNILLFILCSWNSQCPMKTRKTVTLLLKWWRENRLKSRRRSIWVNPVRSNFLIASRRTCKCTWPRANNCIRSPDMLSGAPCYLDLATFSQERLRAHWLYVPLQGGNLYK